MSVKCVNQIYSKLSIILKFRFESHYYFHVRTTKRVLKVSDFKSKYFHINILLEFSSVVYQLEALYFISIYVWFDFNVRTVYNY
jgi:hypothetical protein